MNDMTYYAPTKVDPFSARAGALCQIVANTAKECGYPNCHGEVVGCAVHEANVVEKDERGRSKYHDGAQFLPVCQKHKKWEYAKARDENIAWNLD